MSITQAEPACMLHLLPKVKNENTGIFNFAVLEMASVIELLAYKIENK